MNTIDLRFLENQAGENEGYSDSGIETFRGTPFAAIARETGQNSKDAGIKGETVVVEFEKISVPAIEIPQIEKYRGIVRQCLATAKLQKNSKEIKFFEEAGKTIQKNTVQILRISDYHTSGLTGPCISGKPYHALVKSSGISQKDHDTSGGSFGIGKNAVYALSDLQTAFYSTLYPDGAEKKFLAQGKSKFRSHESADGKNYLSVGYWGLTQGFMPVEDQNLVPEWVRRTEVGTTICAVGMRSGENWEHEIIASILQNFFQSIHNGGIRFVVQGKEIGKAQVGELFDDESILAGAKQTGNEEDFKFASLLYRCLLDENTVEKEIDIEGAGIFRIKLLLEENFPRRVGILRNGMYITDELSNFGDKFSRFPMHRDFIALVEPLDEDAGRWMKSLENPKHDSLDPERLANEEDRRQAKKFGKKLASKIRELVKEFAKTESGVETDLDELSQFFAVDNKGIEHEDGELDLRTSKITKPSSTSTKPPTPKLPKENEEEGEDGGGQHGEDGSESEEGDGSGPVDGGGDGGTGKSKSRKPVEIGSPRTMIPYPENPCIRRVFFTPRVNGTINLGLEYTGVSDSENIPIKGENIRVECERGLRVSVDVEFEQPYRGPLEVYGWKQQEVES